MRSKAAILILIFSLTGIANGAATDANKERMALMNVVLNSEELVKLVGEYGRDGFVFDGMNWLNTYDNFRYYNLTFKKFNLQGSEKEGQRIYTSITTTCHHRVTLKSGLVASIDPTGCSEERQSISEKELLGKR